MKKSTDLEIKEAILEARKSGNSFAFVIPIAKLTEKWIVIYFLFYQVKPEIICKYIADVVLVSKGEFSQISNQTFESVGELVLSLRDLDIDVNHCRAMH